MRPVSGSSNEAAPYSDVVHAMYQLNPTAPDIPAWLIVDQNYRNRYLFQEVAPLLPFPDSWYQAGAVFKSWTIAGLRVESRVGHRVSPGLRGSCR